ncbi:MULTISPECIES: Eco57I restriction-modification methylase domain-containing protein [Croceicoccus]|jgi:site-specific DNA-methyltransferase (adenine-specific)|uniref:site-specific DNA-methyltransferase (adenine-specific) n=2 Tax=Croceicoccus TaxID=1295327 RepID=A0A1Z1F8Q7_9SPHN|nr:MULTISPECIES: Eco57I restriction-modification methylase domain-containing protein [Croceicoccus]AKM08891.1 restriction endonuclease [Croceicoccus naphthovorans]ARU15087.1 restriction endonuclease [Croceicoccus marinus]MBB3989346.1 site-specific DNA-methyltransferase (adenine-specific) [Croceicoccus naphthovorans]|tara:strand:- start:9083 stop:10663 length:1581 start_codon:yes stop_codon:yes gene_type:complete
MIEQASFALRGRNPDVLTCIANLSNDEVFTPPEFANRMLDTLAEAWAADNGGASIWADNSVRFLDPFTKSGVFLREIAKRLIAGLETEIPDLQTRVDHILTQQVFGIGITRLTSLLARRSLYCSKHATGEHSVATAFANDDGNIWFERTEHSWDGSKCQFCGAPRAIFDREPELENHAYAFIHTNDIKARLGELFGADMQFDVIIGNPPYQMTGGAGGTSDSSIYHLFVEQAAKLEPRFVSMVIPSRWMAGGRGMDGFRQSFLGGGHLRELSDFPASSEVFPGVEIKAGVCYFLWDSAHQGNCNVTTFRGGEALGPVSRKLDEYDIFVRDGRAISILHKVLEREELPINSILSRDTTFGLASNFDGYSETEKSGHIPLFYIRRMKRGIGYVPREAISKNVHLIDRWKLLVPEAYNGGDGLPHQILGKPLIAPAPSACTQSYLVFDVATPDEAASIQSYYMTRFFRFLVSQRKITQHALNSTYAWVPMQTWDRTWTDEVLYEKYRISDEERAYIESQVRSMSVDDGE